MFIPVALVVVFAYWLYQVISSNRRRIPPGPLRFPGIGCIPQVLLADHKLPAVAFNKLRRIYGDIISIQTGTVFFVVVNGYDAIKEVETNDDILDRTSHEWIFDRTYGKNLGLLFNGGRFWNDTRQYTLRTLRDFGFGKMFTIETIIKDELNEFVEVFKERVAQTRNGVMNMTGIFNPLFVNVIWCLVNGERFSYRDPKFQLLLDLVHDVIKTGKFGGGLLGSYPSLQTLAPNWSGFTRYHEANTAIQHYFEDVVEKYKKMGNYKVDPINFIEIFLNCIDTFESGAGMDQNDKMPNPAAAGPAEFYLSNSRRRSSVISIFNTKEKIFTLENLVSIIYDLFFAGAETSSNVLSTAIVYLIRNQDTQNRIRQEIKKLVGFDRLVTAADKKKMTYTAAAVYEALRIASTIPLNPRKTTCKTQVGEYVLPANTIVYTNLYSSNMDSKLWDMPHEFRPERFLTANQDAIINQEKLLAFGSGQRSCPCENIATLSIFLALSNLIQNFEFHADPATGVPSTETHLGLSASPMPYTAYIKARN